VSTLAVVHASELVTLAGPRRARHGSELTDLSIIRDGGMLVQEGVITAVGSSQEIEANARGAEIIDARGRVVMPGFVDAHTHLVFAGNRVDDFERRARGRTYEEIAAAGGGIWSTVKKTRAASEANLVDNAKKHLQWFVESGTTTIEAKSGYGLTFEDELKILAVIRKLNHAGPVEIVPTFLGAHAIPREYRGAPDQYVQLIVEKMLPRVASEKLAEFCDVFCERGYFDVEQARRILSAATELGLNLRAHVDQLSNFGGAKLVAELRATTADHLEKTDAGGIAALQAAGVQPVLLPGSVYALGSSDYPRAREMIGAGLPVVLATDFNPGSSPTASMPMVLSLACTQMKMLPAETITASTVNAAYSLNRGDKIGSLEPGKLANFTVFDCEDYREIAYWFAIPQTRVVYVRGKCVYSKEGRSNEPSAAGSRKHSD
jgi:imidazolonepropionase